MVVLSVLACCLLGIAWNTAKLEGEKINQCKGVTLLVG